LQATKAAAAAAMKEAKDISICSLSGRKFHDFLTP